MEVMWEGIVKDGPRFLKACLFWSLDNSVVQQCFVIFGNYTYSFLFRFSNHNSFFLIPILGWNSPAVQFEGPAVQAVRKSYLSWHPTSFAYTSSAPSAQPHDRVWISNVG
jgi:hypothetical protein